MHLKSLRITNYRRLKDVRIDLDPDASIFVGANNSGKTSATHVFQSFLGSSTDRFSVHDFSADCWAVFNSIGSSKPPSDDELPTIVLDLWFEVQEDDLHRVIKLLPSLDWNGVPIGVRMEFAPKNVEELLENFHEARSKASAAADHKQEGDEGFHPWPVKLTDYLKKRLNHEYNIFYYVLDYNEFDADLKQKDSDYRPQRLGDTVEKGGNIMKSLLRVDFLHAQRHLSDADSGDLSKRISRFYKRNLQQYDTDFEAISTLAKSEAELDKHLSSVFDSTLKRLNTLGYPGFAEPDLVIKSSLDPESFLASKTASVHYALRDPGKPIVPSEAVTLPDKYNGLGFKNLIYMVIELLDYHERWKDEEENRAPLHLVMIEEPEAHLHAQLQQVFIRKIRDVLPNGDPLFKTQLIVTTHSPHIVYERSFNSIRYFRRYSKTGIGNYSNVLNLSSFLETEEHTRDFLRKYMKLTHCDLFFADAAVLVEGNVERLLLPLIIDKDVGDLKSSYLSILEVGGAFAHVFRELIHFLGLTALVITDLDSVHPAPNKTTKPEDDTETSSAATDVTNDDESPEADGRTTCTANTPNAVTANQTLIKWLPKKHSISELLSTDSEEKTHMPTAAEPAKVRVAYQTEQPIQWGTEKANLAGRTFEEAFAYQNLAWCQDKKRKQLRLRVAKNESLSLQQIAEKIHERVKKSSFKKTDFALALMLQEGTEWEVPTYIIEGLQWLKEQLLPIPPDPKASVPSTETEPAQ